jgi:broad specificity phosphatase PhoE
LIHVGSIYLIRHGQASFGADDYDVLSPTGMRQAKVLGDHLVRLGSGLDRCVSGGLRRQQHTAELTLTQLRGAGLSTATPEVDSAFDEFDADATIRALLPAMMDDEPGALDIVARWLSGEHDTQGLQSWAAFVAQVQAGLTRLLERATAGERIAVFTSGGTITALLHLITGMPALQAFELNWHIVNTSLSQLRFRGSAVSLASFNDYAHLQLMNSPQLITYR